MAGLGNVRVHSKSGGEEQREMGLEGKVVARSQWAYVLSYRQWGVPRRFKQGFILVLIGAGGNSAK